MQFCDYGITIHEHRDGVKDYFPINVRYVPKKFDNDSGDAPVTENQEIEATPEMIEAGIRALGDWRFGDDFKEIVKSVYYALRYEKNS